MAGMRISGAVYRWIWWFQSTAGPLEVFRSCYDLRSLVSARPTSFTNSRDDLLTLLKRWRSAQSPGKRLVRLCSMEGRTEEHAHRSAHQPCSSQSLFIGRSSRAKGGVRLRRSRPQKRLQPKNSCLVVGCLPANGTPSRMRKLGKYVSTCRFSVSCFWRGCARDICHERSAGSTFNLQAQTRLRVSPWAGEVVGQRRARNSFFDRATAGSAGSRGGGCEKRAGASFGSQ